MLQSVMDKDELLAAIIEKLSVELGILERAARSIHEGAVHGDAVAEDKYDTYGLEASYLAGAQAGRVKELRASVGALRAMPMDRFGPDDPIRPSALVEIEAEDETKHVLLALAGGGVTVDVGGVSVQVVTPHPPLGSKILGKSVDDEFQLDLPGGIRDYEIVGVS
jgi:transcription elongation GreA/GreB family factor